MHTGTPDVPRNIKVVCEISGARVQWISSFNGGDTQTFIIHANGDRKTTFSSRIPDAGENTIHTNYVENLQASVSYVFHVSAQNRYGNSSSENITCITLKKGIQLCLFYRKGSQLVFNFQKKSYRFSTNAY